MANSPKELIKSRAYIVAGAALDAYKKVKAEDTSVGFLDGFEQGAEWEHTNLINKAYQWIRYNNENGGCYFDNWEESFRKAMEE